jgi:hypothetical protein
MNDDDRFKQAEYECAKMSLEQQTLNVLKQRKVDEHLDYFMNDLKEVVKDKAKKIIDTYPTFSLVKIYEDLASKLFLAKYFTEKKLTNLIGEYAEDRYIRNEIFEANDGSETPDYEKRGVPDKIIDRISQLHDEKRERFDIIEKRITAYENLVKFEGEGAILVPETEYEIMKEVFPTKEEYLEFKIWEEKRHKELSKLRLKIDLYYPKVEETSNDGNLMYEEDNIEFTKEIAFISSFVEDKDLQEFYKKMEVEIKTLISDIEIAATQVKAYKIYP